MGAVSLVFIDGWGIGENSKESNPYFHAATPFFDRITGGYGIKKPMPLITSEYYAIIPTDACLGVPGLPQSATGQTAIITGINAPLLMGRHINGYPGYRLRQIITSNNIMQMAQESGYDAFLVNAYSPEYFAAIEAKKRKHAAFALMAIAADVPFPTMAQLRQNDSIYQDITNVLLQKRGHSVSLRDPYDAGVLYNEIMRKYDLTVFEYFQTDTVGHSRDMDAAVKIYETLDRFLAGILQELDVENDSVIVVSDHGNIEDISIGTHTMNPVPTILLGKSAVKHASMVESITDIACLIRVILNERNSGG